MAIIRIRRRPNAGARIGPRGERTWKRTYQIFSDTPSELRSEILMHPATPKYGYPHPEDPFATVSDIDLVQLADNPKIWELSVTWSSLHDQGRDKDQQQKPTDRRPQWSAQFRPIPTSRRRDLAGKLFADSAGTPFSPPPDIPIYVDEITISRWETAWNRERDRQYLNATNVAKWQNSEACEALVDNIRVTEQYEFGQYWYHYTYTILDNPKIVAGGVTYGGWDPYYALDAGPKYLDRSTGTPTPTVFKDGDYVDGAAQLLDGNGNPLGRIGGVLRPEVYLTFRVKNKKNFTALKLDPPWQNPKPDQPITW